MFLGLKDGTEIANNNLTGFNNKKLGGMNMKKFNYHAPTNLEGVLKVLEQEQQDAYFIAGGTDIMIQMERKFVQPKTLINLKSVSELNYIREDGDTIRVGATTTFTELERSLLINQYAKVLAKAASEVGSPQIRNLGTIGGNISNASAAADSVTALMALDAKVKLESTKGERVMELKDFYVGNGQTNRRANEVLTEIFFNKRVHTKFRKLGRRKALAIVVLSVGAAFDLDFEANKFTDVRISLGAVSRHPMRVNEAEKILEGQEISLTNIESCIDTISKIVDESVSNSPFKNLAPYKRESVKGVAKEVMIGIYQEQMNKNKGV